MREREKKNLLSFSFFMGEAKKLLERAELLFSFFYFLVSLNEKNFWREFCRANTHFKKNKKIFPENIPPLFINQKSN